MQAETGSRILVVHESLPRPDRNACDLRLMQVLNELRAQGHELTYVARYEGDQARHAQPLEQMGVKVYSHDVSRLRRFGADAVANWTFEGALKAGRFDLAILFHWYWNAISVAEDYLDEIRRLSPQTRVAVLTDDLHGLRERRLAEVSGLWADLERARDLELREFEAYRHADMVLAISETVRRGLLATDPGLEVEILPNVAETQSCGPEFALRANLLLLANFQNGANREGLNWLLAEVWPRVAPKLPGVELHLAGYQVPESVAGDRVVPLGYVDDLDAAFAQHRVFVAPIRCCGGVQTKVLEALSRGLPVVTTPAAAEGLNLQDEKEVLLAATPEEFARQINRLYCDEDLWRKLSQGGAEFVRHQYSRERLAAQMRRVIERVRELGPKRYDARHVWSVLKVEKEFPDVLTRPARERILSRLQSYCTLAECLLAEGNPLAALEHLRHIFTFVPAGKLRDPFFARVLLDFDRSYRALGTPELSAGYITSARECLSQSGASGGTDRGAQTTGNAPRTRRKSKPPRPLISVIIPTCNRCAVLAACLDALGRQTVAMDSFEAVVIDDGSTDGTELFCRDLSTSFPLVYRRQTNAGAGAARKLGSEMARGKYLLFFNDDTISTPDLLAEHLRAQHEHAQDQCAVLGFFPYHLAVRKRALSVFIATRPFLFPYLAMKPGFYKGAGFFITCNLSIRRDAVHLAGSFDSEFRVAEDTELGARLDQEGYRILYQPRALAWHDHLIFTAADLIKRAQAYADADLQLYTKHPRLLGAGQSAFGHLDAAWAGKVQRELDESRGRVAEWTQAIARFDKLDFAPLFSMRNGNSSEAELVLRTFDQIVPQVYRFHLFERLLELRERDFSCQPSALSGRHSVPLAPTVA